MLLLSYKKLLYIILTHNYLSLMHQTNYFESYFQSGLKYDIYGISLYYIVMITCKDV